MTTIYFNLSKTERKERVGASSMCPSQDSHPLGGRDNILQGARLDPSGPPLGATLSSTWSSADSRVLESKEVRSGWIRL